MVCRLWLRGLNVHLHGALWLQISLALPFSTVTGPAARFCLTLRTCFFFCFRNHPDRRKKHSRKVGGSAGTGLCVLRSQLLCADIHEMKPWMCAAVSLPNCHGYGTLAWHQPCVNTLRTVCSYCLGKCTALRFLLECVKMKVTTRGNF